MSKVPSLPCTEIIRALERAGWQLALVAGCASPVGAWLAQRFNPNLLWGLYFASVGYLLYRMVHPRVVRKEQTGDTRKATPLVIPRDL